MATRVISTSIKLDGEAEFKRQMSNVNSELKTLRSEMAYSEEAFKGQANTMEALTAKDKLLHKEIEQQEEKVRALEKAVSDSTEAFGENDKRTDSWRQSLNRAKTDLLKMNRELDDNSRYLDEARKSADKTADSIDEFGREVKGAGGGLDDFLGSLGDMKGLLAGGAVGLGIGALKEVGSAIMDLEESTREYRSIMGALDISSKQAGYTTEQTAEAYDYLYGVLGDSQTTATTIANLQAIGLSQKDLMKMVDAATGALAKYGDSMPIDGLAESVNETIKAGQVTGTFADVLNWGTREGETFGLQLKDNIEFTKLTEKELKGLTESQRAQYEETKAQYDATEKFNESLQDCKSAEDYFNLALSECTTDAERANLVMKAMSEQGLTEAGQSYRDLNGDIISANDSQNRMEKAWGELGETLEPVASFFRETLAGAIETTSQAVKDAYEFVEDLITIFGDLNDKINGWIDSWDFSGVYDWVDKINKKMADTEWGDGTVQASLDSFSARVDAIPHANGLDRVPYDGYLAELHLNEAVLTAQENRVWQQFKAGGYQPQQAVTAEQLQAMLVGTVNALNSQRGGTEYVGTTVIQIDGQAFARATQPYFRAEDKSNPEVVSDV